jgi:hypothetical protein
MPEDLLYPVSGRNLRRIWPVPTKDERRINEGRMKDGTTIIQKVFIGQLWPILQKPGPLSYV